MSFKRFDPEDIVLSSELITFPTWFVKDKGDFDEIEAKDLITSEQQGASKEYFIDFYNVADFVATGSEGEEPHVETGFDITQSKCMFSVAYAVRPHANDQDTSSYTSSKVDGGDVPITNEEVVFGQYRSLVLGDEDSGFRFGSTQVGVNSENVPEADRFFAITVDRARFREKLEPVTCRLVFKASSDADESASLSDIIASGSDGYLILAPDVTANERYLDSGRVYDLAEYVISPEEGKSNYKYPDETDNRSYGYFLPDIGVILINADIAPFNTTVDNRRAIENAVDPFFNILKGIKLRSQETVTSNYVFARARNAEFNYSTNPSNITGSAGNLRWGTMINQPQAFITTVGLYNDSNELLAVAKLSKPLVKDFTKEALIRIKLDY